jgi:hypothetical protein
MTDSRKNLIITMAVLTIIMGAFFIFSGALAFFGGGFLSFFASSYGLKTAFGGILKSLTGVLAIYSGTKGLKYAVNYSNKSNALFSSAALTAILVLAFIFSVLKGNANILTIINPIISAVFTYSVFRYTH